MKKILFLLFLLVVVLLSSCQNGDAPKIEEVEGNVSTVASSRGKADLGNRVWHDDNGDGIKQRREKGFAGVTVNLYLDIDGDGTADGEKIASKVTNPRGYYKFKLLDPEPDYIIEVVKPAGYIFSEMNNEDARGKDWDSDIEPDTGFSDTIDLRRGRYTYWIDAALRPEQIVDTSPADLGDTVWFDENRDGIRQSTEKGMADVKVSLYVDTNNDGKPDKRLETTYTDDEGDYQFEDLDPTKVYFVTLVLDDYRGFSELHNPAAPSSSALPGSDFDNDFDPISGFAGPITLVPGEYNKWAADAGIREFHHSYQVQVYGKGRVVSGDDSIDCNQYGGKCFTQVPWGTEISLKADPDSNQKFSNWVMYYLNSQYIVSDPRNPVFQYQLNSHRIFTAKFVDKKKLNWSAKSFRLAKWSPDGSKIAAGNALQSNAEKLFSVFDAETGNLLYSLDAWAAVFDWSPDGSKIALTQGIAGTNKYKIMIVNSGDGSLISSFIGEGSFGALSWSPDGSKIAAIDYFLPNHGHRPHPKLKIYDVSSGQELSYLGDLASRIRGPHVLAWSPNSKYLASLSQRIGRDSRSDVNIWRIKTDGSAEQIFNSYEYFQGENAEFNGRLLAWAANSKNLISFYSEEGEPWLARVRLSDSEVFTYKEVSEIPRNAAISHNFKYIAFAKNGELNLIQVFRLSNMKKISEFAEHTDSIQSISWSKNDKSIVSADNSQELLVWKVKP